ncbi:MAG: prepilin peptidase [Patescibacteria group bacterium]
MYNGLILSVLLGLAAGSFLNVVIARIDDLHSIWRGRSHCPNCKKNLAWYDLVPLLSFALLKARCRHCSQPISWQYPLVEAGFALVVTLLYLEFGFSWHLLFYGAVFALLAVVFVYDLLRQLIPEEFAWATLGLTLLFGWYFGNMGFGQSLAGGLIGGGVPGLLVLVSRERWMGSGDIKIGAILGLLLGYPLVILGLFLSFVLGSVLGVGLIAFGGKKLKDALPFAPFLIVAMLLALVSGRSIINWYFNNLFGY